MHTFIIEYHSIKTIFGMINKTKLMKTCTHNSVAFKAGKLHHTRDIYHVF